MAVLHSPIPSPQSSTGLERRGVLPAVAEDVDLTVTTVGLKADWSGDESDLWFGDSLTVTPEIVVKVNGVESVD